MLGKGRLPGPQAREGRLGIHAVCSAKHALSPFQENLEQAYCWIHVAISCYTGAGGWGEGLEHPKRAGPMGICSALTA